MSLVWHLFLARALKAMNELSMHQIETKEYFRVHDIFHINNDTHEFGVLQAIYSNMKTTCKEIMQEEIDYKLIQVRTLKHKEH